MLACNKWQEIFQECEQTLGVSGDAANDVFSAWSKLASDAFSKKPPTPHHHEDPAAGIPRRSNSLTGLHRGKTVKVPVQLIPLERARAKTSGSLNKDDAFLASLRTGKRSLGTGSLEDTLTSLSYGERIEEDRMQISRPINLEESTFCCSYPSGLSYKISVSPYAPQADHTDTNTTTSSSSSLRSGSRSNRTSSSSNCSGLNMATPEDNYHQARGELEGTVGPKEVRTGIQNYVNKAFSTSDHPLGVLMNRVEMVYRLSYGGLGASKFLLSHAIAETHSIIQRVHRIVRLVSGCGLGVGVVCSSIVGRWVPECLSLQFWASAHVH